MGWNRKQTQQKHLQKKLKNNAKRKGGNGKPTTSSKSLRRLKYEDTVQQ